MTIVRESFNSQANTSATTTPTVNAPAGVVSGDVLVCCIAFNGSPGTITPPSGWVEMDNEIGASNPRVWMWLKVAGGSEPSTYQWSHTTSVTSGMAIARYSGVDNTTPQDVTAVSTFSATTVNALNLTGVTINTAGAMLVSCCSVNSSTTTITENSALVTEVVEVGGKKIEMDDGVQASTGATGTVNYTFGANRACAGIVGALKPAAGGTQYNQSATGGLSFSGGLSKQGQKVITGSISFSGALAKMTSRALAAILSFSGSITKQARKSFTGALSFLGNLTAGKIVLKILSGALSFSGSLSRMTGKSFSGSVSFFGAILKQTGKSLGGSLSFSGALASAKVVLKILSGALSFSGSLSKSTNKPLNGLLEFTGTIFKQARKSLTGSISPTGALASIKTFLVVLSGSLSFSGSLGTQRTISKILSGALSFSGNLLKRTSKTFSGSLSFAGLLAGSKIVTKILTGALSFSGSVTKRSEKLLTGALGFSGSVTKQINKALAGALSFLGTLTTFIPGAARISSISFSLRKRYVQFSYTERNSTTAITVRYSLATGIRRTTQYNFIERTATFSMEGTQT